MSTLWKRRIAILASLVLAFGLACSCRLLKGTSISFPAFADEPTFAQIGTASLSDAGDTLFIRMAKFNVGTEEEPDIKYCSGFTVGDLGPEDNPTQNVNMDVLTPIWPDAPLTGTLDKDIYICGGVDSTMADLYVDGLTQTEGHKLTAVGAFDVKMGALSVGEMIAPTVGVYIGDKASVTVNGNASVNHLWLYKPNKYNVMEGQADPATYNPQYLGGTLHVTGNLSGGAGDNFFLSIAGRSAVTVDGNVSGLSNNYWQCIQLSDNSSLTVGGSISVPGGIAVTNSALSVTKGVSASVVTSNGSAIAVGGDLNVAGDIWAIEDSLTVGGSLSGATVYFDKLTETATVGGKLTAGNLWVYGTGNASTSKTALTVTGDVSVSSWLDINKCATVTADDVTCKQLYMEEAGPNVLNAATFKCTTDSCLYNNSTLNVTGDCTIEAPLFNINGGSHVNVGGDITVTNFIDVQKKSSLTVEGDITFTTNYELQLQAFDSSVITCKGDVTAKGTVSALTGAKIAVTGKLTAGSSYSVNAMGSGSEITADAIDAVSVNAIGGRIDVAGTIRATGNPSVNAMWSGSVITAGVIEDTINVNAIGGGKIAVAGKLKVKGWDALSVNAMGSGSEITADTIDAITVNALNGAKIAVAGKLSATDGLSVNALWGGSEITAAVIDTKGCVNAIGNARISVTGALTTGDLGGLGVLAIGKDAVIEAESIDAPYINALGYYSGGSGTSAVIVRKDANLSHWPVIDDGGTISVGNDLTCESFSIFKQSYWNPEYTGWIRVGGDMRYACNSGDISRGELTVGGDFINEAPYSGYSQGLILKGGKLNVGGNVEFGSLLLNTQGNNTRLNVTGRINAARITDIIARDENGDPLNLHTVAPFESAIANGNGIIIYQQPWDAQYVLMADDIGNGYRADISDLTKTSYPLDESVSFTYVLNDRARWYCAVPSKGYKGMSIKLPTGEDMAYADGVNALTGWSTNADGSGTVYAPGESVTMNSDSTFYALWSYCVNTPEAIAAGTVTAQEAAAPGGTVALTLNPGENYAIGSVSYSYNDGKDDHVVSVDPVNGAYSFVMPEHGVSVSATWKKCLTHADISVEIPSAVYTGAALSPAVTVKDGDQTLAENSDYTVALPEGRINAGNYTVTVNAAESSAGYSGSTTATFSITLASVTLTANSDTKTYTGETYTVEGFTPSVEGLTFDGVSASGSGTNADKYDVAFTGVTVNETKDSTGNYLVTATTNGKLTILKAAPANVTVPMAKTLIYTGFAQKLVTVGEATGGTMYYAVTTENTAPTDENLYTTSIPEKTEAGTYYVWYKVVGDDNHNDTAPVKVEVTIAPKSLTGATVTLDKTQFTYNGSQQSVNVTGVAVDSLTLTANDYTITGSTTGADANTYTVTVTGVGNFKDAATAQWKIVEKVMTVTAQDVSATYDGQPHGITVNVTDPASGATVQYGQTAGTYNQTDSPTITNVSDSPLTVYFKVSAANYIDYEGNATVTLAKATGTGFTAPTANTLTYNGKDQPLVTAPTSVPEGYTVQYSLDGTSYDEKIPTGRDAGEYTVKVKYVPDGNHNDVDGTEVKVTIARATGTPTAPTANTLTYTGEDQPLVTAPANVPEGYTVQYSLDGTTYTDKIPIGKAAGDYTVKVKYVPDMNHNDVDGTEVKVTIARATGTPTAPTANTLTYTGEDQPLVTAPASISTGYTVQYSLDGTNYSDKIPTGKAAGDYTVKVKYAPDANHNGVDGAEVKATIAKATGAPTAPTANTLTYNGEAQALVTAPANVPEGYTVQYSLDGNTYSDKIPTGKDAGDYTVKVKFVPDANHADVDGTEVKATIAKATGAPTAPTANTLTYNGEAQALVTTPANVPEGYTVQYSLDGNTYSDKIPTGKDAGDYTVKVKFVPDANHADVNGADVKVTIAKKALTVTANAQTKKAGEKDPELTYKPEGLVGNDKLTGALSRVAGEDVGTYDITVGDLKATDNYTLKFVGAKLTITAADEGNVEIEIETARDVPKTEIEGVTTELAQTLATDDELQRIENGEDMKLTLEINNIEDTVSKEDKAKVEKAMGEGDNVAMYLDISMYKQVGDDAPEKVTELGGKTVTVTITIPEEQRKEGRTFSIVQVHDGEIIVYGPFTGDTITLELSGFSTFVLTYQDERESIEITGGDRQIYIENTVNLNKLVVIQPKGLKTELTWKSSKPSIASVSKKGVVKGLKKGKATITVTTKGGASASIIVEVLGKAPTKVTLTGGTVEVGKTINLADSVKLTPKNVKTTLKWKSSKPTIADVDENGVVTGLKPGTATITVTTLNNKTAKATVKVTGVAPKSVKLTGGTRNIKVGEELDLGKAVKLTPKNATTTFKWKSSKPTIADVDENGVVKGLKPGTATITVTTANNRTAKLTVKVIKVPVKKIKFKVKEIKLTAGQNLNLNEYVVLTPKNATAKFKWKSSNSKVAPLDKNGVLKGKKAGKTTITVTTDNGKKAKVDLIVENKAMTLEIHYDESYAESAENAMIEQSESAEDAMIEEAAEIATE